MDWTKLNMAEVSWFCRPGNSFFAASQFDVQLEALVLLFHHYGIRQFSVQDVQALYKMLEIPTPGGRGIVKPQPARVRKTAERIQTLRLTADGAYEIVPAETGLYLPFDPGIYANALASGYQKHEI